jgi:hypothetical protein
VADAIPGPAPDRAAIFPTPSITGYLHPRYAESLAEFGTPRELPRCGGWILERRVPGFPYKDAMGCYPLFACRDWSQLHADLAELGDDLVSIALVPEPFGRYDRADLEQCFPDRVVPFKDHSVFDLSKSPQLLVSRHHRKCARRALTEMTIEAHPDPPAFLDEFVRLHQTLVARHQITGLRAFSRQAFALQLETPGAVLLRAIHHGENVGATLSFVQGEVGYGHVLALSEKGYELGATYALYWFSLQHFADKVRWYSVGGMPSITSKSTEGLDFFKRGWSPHRRRAYFCGRILNPQRYAEIMQVTAGPATDFFPAYRHGELG